MMSRSAVWIDAMWCATVWSQILSAHTTTTMIEVVHDQAWTELPSDAAITQAIVATLRAVEMPCRSSDQPELCILLADNPAMQALNSHWREMDEVTDVLAFPMQEGRIDPTAGLGDIVVAIPFVKQEAERLHLPFADHLIHLLIHGTLHLLGFDHAEKNAGTTMRNHECNIMKQLHLHCPWPEKA
ncbi:MAG: rRNA maturation RNase YbeY [Mariprofundales bacterium]|nr:rRNA maturation RNase YbeY [Mariprofundales bacterium]